MPTYCKEYARYYARYYAPPEMSSLLSFRRSLGTESDEFRLKLADLMLFQIQPKSQETQDATKDSSSSPSSDVPSRE